MTEPAIEIRDLSFTYPKSAASRARKALDGFSLNVEPGEVFGLLGPNGGGKTTLFKILSTVFLPSEGYVKIAGCDAAREPGRVREKIGVVFQAPSLDKKLTVWENLLHQGHLYGLEGKVLHAKAALLMEKLSLTEKSGDWAETLSGGLQRRAEIAKGLLHEPKILLMDEPGTGLDPGARRDLWAYLRELKKEGMTVLATTHLMDEAEKCDRLAILNEGRLVALGSPARLKEEIGGDVITVETDAPESLARSVREKFNLESLVLERAVRIEKERGHEFVPQLVQAFSGSILSVTVGKPTLEDVFVHRTGHRFWSDRGGEA